MILHEDQNLLADMFMQLMRLGGVALRILSVYPHFSLLPLLTLTIFNHKRPFEFVRLIG
jgi:hypothetical protein